MADCVKDNARFRAQRLSASQGATHMDLSEETTAEETVLNAFRHHRVLRHVPGPPEPPGDQCAQRLSASQGATQ